MRECPQCGYPLTEIWREKWKKTKTQKLTSIVATCDICFYDWTWDILPDNTETETVRYFFG